MLYLLLSFACTGRNACFVEGTQITMSNGFHKNIEDVRVGDSVLSYNVNEESFVERDVLNLIRKSSDEIFTIETTSSYFEGVTAEHPFYQPDTKSWVAVDELSVGDQVLVSNQGRKHIERIVDLDVEYLDRAVEVYNMTVEGPEHNYFANDVLVHNKLYAIQAPFYSIEITDGSDGEVLSPGLHTMMATINIAQGFVLTDPQTLTVNWSVSFPDRIDVTDCEEDIQLLPDSLPEVIQVECEYYFDPAAFYQVYGEMAEGETYTLGASIRVNVHSSAYYSNAWDTSYMSFEYTEESTDTGE